MRWLPGALLVIRCSSVVGRWSWSAVAPGDLGVQGIEPLFPPGPVPAQPLVDLGQRLGAEAVDPPLRLLADLDQSRLAQHPQVPRMYLS
jgi:hypothetical protein